MVKLYNYDYVCFCCNDGVVRKIDNRCRHESTNRHLKNLKEYLEKGNKLPIRFSRCEQALAPLDEFHMKCDCGSIVKTKNYYHHKKTAIHKTYLENINKVPEPIILKPKHKKEDESLYFECPCGSHIKKVSKFLHKKTKIHKDYLKKNAETIKYIDYIENGPIDLSKPFIRFSKEYEDYLTNHLENLKKECNYDKYNCDIWCDE